MLIYTHKQMTTKKKHIIQFFITVFTTLQVVAQEPLYIVNGRPCDEISSIPPEQIESTDMLPADEETIARYGPRASNGVMLITLRLDQQAEFTAGESFAAYIASQTQWSDKEPAARVIVRYTITPDGRTEIDKVLESTDSRLRRRVVKALTEAPLWHAATKNGVPVASQGVLRIELPEGKKMPRPVELILR